VDTVTDGLPRKEQRLGEILAAYLEAIDAGWAPPREDVLASYPDLSADLTTFFACQDEIARLALPSTTPLPPALRQPPPEPTGRRAETRLVTPGDEPPTTVMPPSAPLLPRPGDGLHEMGDYELLAEIRRGGMGVIYRARQKSLNRIVALKMMRTGPWATPAEVQRFRNEAEEVANLDHPNIVPIYEVGEFYGLVYFSMKLFEGGCLTDHLEKYRNDPRGAARLLARVARAVHHAHRRGLLHRDLKPANILLDQEGEPHVTDFGLAKRIQPGAPVSPKGAPAHGGVSEPRPSGGGNRPPLPDGRGSDTGAGLTEVGAVVGTPGYMSPEQAAGQKTLTTAVDVYGLGAVLYKLLTGRPPFEGASMEETLRQVAAGNPRPPRAHNPRVDPRLEAVCMKCLEKDPERRYRSTEAVAEDLERWLAGKPPLAWPLPWRLRAWRAVRRHLAVSAVVAVCTLAAATALLSFSFDPDRPLYAAQQRLARGEPVTLIGATGPPAWWSLSQGEDATTLTRGKNVPFALATMAAGQLKLLPDPQTDRYRFRAEVRHDDAMVTSEAGIYFGFRTTQTATGVAHFWCSVLYADRGLNARTSWPRGQEGKGVPTLSRVGLTVHRFTEPNGGSIHQPVFGMFDTFEPAPHNKPIPWRQLAVEVTPGAVRVFWEGQLIPNGEISVDRLNQQVNMLYKQTRRDIPGTPFTFAPRGALGLLVNRGKASFRNVAVEPLR
jgi:serine/threonine protein kinase